MQARRWAMGSCDSGTSTYTGLADGSHEFAVTATDAAGNEDLTPAIYTWTVDTAPPAATILYPLNGTGIISGSYTIEGSASDIGSSVTKIELSINGGAWTAVTGTTGWSYNCSIPSDGTYTIETRATDAAGNIETPHGVIVSAYVRTPNHVTTSGRLVLVNSNPITVKGINYLPVPVGETPETVPYGDYFTADQSGIYGRDLQQIRQMKANVISLWRWDSNGDHAGFLDAAYNGGVRPV